MNSVRRLLLACLVAFLSRQGEGNFFFPAQTASLYADKTFARNGISLLAGTNRFTAIAQDSYGRSDTNVLSLNLPASVSLAYDRNGNLTNNGVLTFAYDDADRLVHIELPGAWHSEIGYDGLGRKRVEENYVWFNGAYQYSSYTLYVYDGSSVVQQRFADEYPPINYVRGSDVSGTLDGAGGIGGLLCRSETATGGVNRKTFYHSDANGNVTALVNQSQQVVGRYLYDPFGNTLGLSGFMAEVNPFRFSSRELEPNSGLYDFGARFYDANLQRWINRDPSGEDGGLNLYAYGFNSPVNGLDLYGADFYFTTSQGVARRLQYPYADTAGFAAIGENAEYVGSTGGGPPGNLSAEVGYVYRAADELLRYTSMLAPFPPPPDEGTEPGSSLDTIQDWMDYASFVPVVSEPINLLNASLYGIRGKTGPAILAVVPGGRVLHRFAKELKVVRRMARIVPKMTKWGWEGAKAWREAVRLVQKGGTIREIGGKVASKQEALRLIEQAGATVERIEGPHLPPNPHNFPHINFTSSSGAKGTIQIETP